MNRTNARFALLALALVGAACSDQPADGPTLPTERVVELDGVVAALQAHRGKPLLVNFWALWCPPCIRELPDLDAAAKDYATRGGAVIAVSLDRMGPGDQDLDKLRGRIASYWQRREFSLPVWLYGPRDAGPLLDHFELPDGVPVTLAIAADGRVVDRHVGGATRAQFDALFERASR